MAAKRKGVRKARKPKFIDVRGHELTEAMYADYQRYIDRRKDTNHGSNISQIEYLALDDLLAGYRPSKKIKRQLPALANVTMDVCLAISAMKQYVFYAGEPGSIRASGCHLLREMAQELSKAAGTLTALATGVETEDRMQVQGWLRQAALLEQLGCSKEFAHGNC